MDDVSKNLCLECRSLNFDHLFRELLSSEPGLKDEPLVLKRTAEWPSTQCPLCEFFLDMLPKDEKDSFDTVYLRRRRGYKGFDLACQGHQLSTVEVRTALSVETNTGRMSGSYVHYSKEPEVGAFIDCNHVDYRALRFWLEKSNHTERDPMDTLPVAVIDCHARKIVKVTRPLDYVALSYVWGQTSQAAPQNDSLPAKIPRTVEDAMHVVVNLGLQYLWVDRYCLDATNKAQFQAQLNLMADIYRHARMTIIAAAGSDADYGLPGVGSRPRVKQPRVKVGQYTLWSSLQPPQAPVIESAWMKRAWTHQEGVFSLHWIAFTDEQVYFQRSNKEWDNQERGWKTSSEMYRGLGADPNNSALQMFDNIWRNEGAVHVMLQQYTGRNLTYQSDALNGALGLLKRCGNGPYPMCHYFGIPILGPLVNHRKAMGRDPSRSWALTEAFVAGLGWTSGETGQRRAGFPSWSWTGWQVSYRKPTWALLYQGPSFNSLITTKVRVWDGNGLADWENTLKTRTWDVYDDISSLHQELYFEAPTMPIVISPGSWADEAAGYRHAAKLTPMAWCAKFSGADCDVFVEVDLVDAAVESSILTSGNASMKSIILRHVDVQRAAEAATRGAYGVNEVWLLLLVVREEAGGATRVGSVELRQDNYVVVWKTAVNHPVVKESGRWVQDKYIEYKDCSICREKALGQIVNKQVDGITKLA